MLMASCACPTIHSFLVFFGLFVLCEASCSFRSGTAPIWWRSAGRPGKSAPVEKVFLAGIREERLRRIVATGNRSMDFGMLACCRNWKSNRERLSVSMRMRRLPEKSNVAEQYELQSRMLCEIVCRREVKISNHVQRKGENTRLFWSIWRWRHCYLFAHGHL